MSVAIPVGQYLAGLPPDTRSAIDRLRVVVHGADADLVEEIKWNAPSFSHRGRDRITLGVGRKSEVRLVLHRGAKVQDASAFWFEDSARLAKWPSADRGVVTFADEAQIEGRVEELADLIARWIRATDVG